MLCDVHTTNTLSLPSRLMAAAETKSWKIRLFLYPVGNTAIQSPPWSEVSTAWRCSCFSFRGNLAYSGNFWRAIAMLSWCFKWSMYWSSMLQLWWTCMSLWWFSCQLSQWKRYLPSLIIKHVHASLTEFIMFLQLNIIREGALQSCVLYLDVQVLLWFKVIVGWNFIFLCCEL